MVVLLDEKVVEVIYQNQLTRIRKENHIPDGTSSDIVKKVLTWIVKRHILSFSLLGEEMQQEIYENELEYNCMLTDSELLIVIAYAENQENESKQASN